MAKLVLSLTRLSFLLVRFKLYHLTSPAPTCPRYSSQRQARPQGPRNVLFCQEINVAFCLLLQLGCFGVLALLSEAYPVARYPVAWGCDVSLNCMSPVPTHSGGSGSAPPRPSSPSMACTGGGGPLAITVGCMTSSWLAYDLSAHSQLIKVVIK